MKRKNTGQHCLFCGNSDHVSYNMFDHAEKFTDDDRLAIKYKISNSDRERGKIALHFFEMYKPMAIKRINKFISKNNGRHADSYFEEGMAIWGMFVCERLNKWTGESTKREFCSFKNYLYTYADLTVSSTLKEKHANKDNRYVSSDSSEKSIDDFVFGENDYFGNFNDVIIEAGKVKHDENSIEGQAEKVEFKQALLEIGAENINSFTGDIDVVMYSKECGE